ncbi:MAG: hypothetical protein IPI38_01050 [Gemmatimonadetes bacterium]|nr:hypothetical protein [Gemmatimonadota bacterium]
MRRALSLLPLLLLLPMGVHGQETPEAAASAFAATLRTSDWRGAARLMHPTALRQLRDLFSFALNDADDAAIREQIFGVSSPAEAAALPDTILFANFLHAVTTQGGPELLQALGTAEVTPLGHLMQGPDTALVVSRMTMSVQGVSLTSYEVMLFRRERGAWLGLLKADMANMAAMLKQMSGVRGS